MTEEPIVEAAVERYAHLAGRHTHQWHRFVVTAPSFHAAARVTARLGWWLHCWDVTVDDTVTAISVRENAAPEGGWVVDPIDVNPELLGRSRPS